MSTFYQWVSHVATALSVLYFWAQTKEQGIWTPHSCLYSPLCLDFLLRAPKLINSALRKIISAFFLLLPQNSFSCVLPRELPVHKSANSCMSSSRRARDPVLHIRSSIHMIFLPFLRVGMCQKPQITHMCSRKWQPCLSTLLHELCLDTSRLMLWPLANIRSDATCEAPSL